MNAEDLEEVFGLFQKAGPIKDEGPDQSASSTIRSRRVVLQTDNKKGTPTSVRSDLVRPFVDFADDLPTPQGPYE